MASRGGTGIELELDRVPMRERGMTPYEIMLSESQERMLLVLRQGAEDEAAAVFRKWELDVATIGRVTDTGSMVLRFHGKTVADVPIGPVAGNAPTYERPIAAVPAPVPVTSDVVRGALPYPAALERLIGSPELASRRWVYEQYDSTIMADTLAGPGGDAGVVRLFGTPAALALTVDCTPRWVAADPRRGAALVVAEAWRNLTAVGARPLAITDCMNFGNPERPVVMGQFADAVDGMADACRQLDFPVVSGNVSLYNETAGRAIQPTPTVGGLGLLADAERRASIAYDAAELQLVQLGECFGWLGASLYLREVCGREDGGPPPLDLAQERRNGDFVRTEIARGRIRACHDVGDGGLLIALTEMALASGIGLEARGPRGAIPEAGWWFGEEPSRYVAAVAKAELADFLHAASSAGVLARVVARTGGNDLVVGRHGRIPLARLRTLYEGWLPSYMENAGAAAASG
jgi:phosphoribosylformylglycinamidine synthase